MRVNWETANSSCVLQGGRLFDASDNLIRYYGIPSNTGGEYYWTEIHRMPNTNYFQTTDGKSLSDRYYRSYYWEYNHPIDGIDCVGYDGETNKLLSLECNTTHLAVCCIGKYKYMTYYSPVYSGTCLTAVLRFYNKLNILIHKRDNIIL